MLFSLWPRLAEGGPCRRVRHSSPLEPIELPSSFFFLLSVKQDKPLQVCLPCHSCSGILVNNWLSASSLIRQRACCSPSIFHLVLILSVLCFINHNSPSITDPNQSWILAQNLLIKKTVYLNTAHWAADTGRSYTEHEERIKYYKDSNHMINSSHTGNSKRSLVSRKKGWCRIMTSKSHQHQ